MNIVPNFFKNKVSENCLKADNYNEFMDKIGNVGHIEYFRVYAALFPNNPDVQSRRGGARHKSSRKSHKKKTRRNRRKSVRRR